MHLDQNVRHALKYTERDDVRTAEIVITSVLSVLTYQFRKLVIHIVLKATCPFPVRGGRFLLHREGGGVMIYISLNAS